MRRVEVEARYDAPDEFLLRKQRIGGGEIIRTVEDPDEARKRELETKIAEGKSLRQAAKELDMPYTSAHRLVRG